MLQRDEFIFHQHAAIQQRPDQRQFRVDQQGRGKRAAIELPKTDPAGHQIPLVVAANPVAANPCLPRSDCHRRHADLPAARACASYCPVTGPRATGTPSTERVTMLPMSGSPIRSPPHTAFPEAGSSAHGNTSLRTVVLRLMSTGEPFTPVG